MTLRPRTFSLSGRLLSVWLAMALLHMAGSAAFSAAARGPSYEEAVAYCDTGAVSSVEGIWLFPEDGVRVLVRSAGPDATSYVIWLIDPGDSDGSVGDRLGSVVMTGKTDTYILRLPTSRSNGLPAGHQEIEGTLSADGEGMQFRAEKRHTRISLSPTSILTGFWRILRVSIDLPEGRRRTGMIRIYPTYDGNGSMRRLPRYL